MLNVVDEAMKDSKNEENQTVIRWVISKRLKLMALLLAVVGELEELIDKAKEISQRTLFGIGFARILNKI